MNPGNLEESAVAAEPAPLLIGWRKNSQDYVLVPNPDSPVLSKEQLHFYCAKSSSEEPVVAPSRSERCSQHRKSVRRFRRDPSTEQLDPSVCCSGTEPVVQSSYG